MKKIVEVIIPAQPEKKTKKEVFVCDICGEVTQSYYTCHSCGRIMCHKMNNTCSEIDPHEYGDYPDRYCTICYNLKYKKYEEDYCEIEENYEEEKRVLDDKVREESLLTK